jgi:predicted PurR-regulated permease PerM
LLSGILLPFVAGLALAYFLDPVADALERLGLPRLAATLTILLLSILALVLVLLLILPVLGDQIVKFAADLPGLLQTLAVRFNEAAPQWLKDMIAKSGTDIQGQVTALAGRAAGWIVTLITSVWSGGMALVNLLSLLVVTLSWLYSWRLGSSRRGRSLAAARSRRSGARARDIDAAMAGFIRGQGTVCLLLGAFYAVALTLAGLKFGLAIGLAAGLLTFIPYVGAIVGGVLAVGVALVQFWPDFGSILLIFAIFAVGQFIEGNVLSPKLVGKSVACIPSLMFALFAFGFVFNFVGLLLAVPTACGGV